MSQTSKQSGFCKTAQHQGQTITTLGTREKELGRVKRAVEQAADIRQERVEAAKLVLKEARLKLNVNDLAKKILADPLNQKSIEKYLNSSKLTKPRGILTSRVWREGDAAS